VCGLGEARRNVGFVDAVHDSVPSRFQHLTHRSTYARTRTHRTRTHRRQISHMRAMTTPKGASRGTRCGRKEGMVHPQLFVGPEVELQRANAGDLDAQRAMHA
jgi:hypothetical protein